MSRDIWSLDDESVSTGMTGSVRRYQTKQGEQVNSRKAQKINHRNASELKKRFNKEELRVYLDREREELPEELRRDVYKIPDAIVREIRELAKIEQPKGFWTQYAKTHKLPSSSVHDIRVGKSRKGVK